MIIVTPEQNLQCECWLIFEVSFSFITVSMSVNCWKVVVEKQKFGEMNHTKNMIVVDNLFITCCFLIVASSKCKSLSLVLVYVVSVIPILYCSYWHCTFVSDTMHMTYTGLFSHANGPNLIKQHFYLTADLIARLDTFLLLANALKKATAVVEASSCYCQTLGYLLSYSCVPIIFSPFSTSKTKLNPAHILLWSSSDSLKRESSARTSGPTRSPDYTGSELLTKQTCWWSLILVRLGMYLILIFFFGMDELN